MSLKVSVFIATSLDGFIARRDGELDWLDDANTRVPVGEDCGFKEFMGSVDALIMGRKTFEKVLSFGEWPYGQAPVVVLSRKQISFPIGVPSTVSHSSDSLCELLERLSHEGAKHVYVDGGKTIQGFLADGLINEITLTVIPIILGDGIPLFGLSKDDVSLTHLRTTVYDFGFVQTTYSVNENE
jgi:dihydrofolate reductase